MAIFPFCVSYLANTVFVFNLCLGYSPTVKGQLLHVDTTSSMQYRTLLEAEMLAVSTAHDFVCL